MADQKKRVLEMEIFDLKNTRDNYINNAIGYALTIVDNDIQERHTFSTATIVLSSILSLLYITKNSFKISFVNSTNLSLVSTKLTFADSSMFQLKNSIEELKRVCNVV
jgi:hypothetical protein